MHPAAPPPTRWLPWTLGLFTAIAVGIVLFRYNPSEHAFYPGCPLYKLTGLACPGCGSLRALHQLTHGHWGEALRLNPLLVMSLPLLFWIMLRKGMGETAGRRLPPIPVPRRWGWLLAGALFVFSILRNLPFAPFSQLAP